MTNETITKIWEINNTIVLTIPKGIAGDSSFPFELEKNEDGTIKYGLQKKFGDTWFVDAIPRINRFDMEYIREAVLVGAKKDGKKHTVDFNALDCPVGEIAEVVLDSLFLAMHGRSFNDHLAYIDSMRQANAGKDEDSGNA